MRRLGPLTIVNGQARFFGGGADRICTKEP
jgi:hypothetical protein